MVSATSNPNPTPTAIPHLSRFEGSVAPSKAAKRHAGKNNWNRLWMETISGNPIQNATASSVANAAALEAIALRTLDGLEKGFIES